MERVLAENVVQATYTSEVAYQDVVERSTQEFNLYTFDGALDTELPSENDVFRLYIEFVSFWWVEDISVQHQR